MSRLLDESTLENSWVVANCSMNRGRDLDSYSRELRFPLNRELSGSWLDLCCGEARALAQAARRFPDVRLVGVDLVDFFGPLPASVERVVSSVTDYRTDQLFDLITCVHGLHYVGDKLGLLQRACTWLKPQGVLLAHLDLDNLRVNGRRPGPKWLCDHGLEYHRRFRLLTCRGARHLDFACAYQGADDASGPNFTGQAAVTSHYGGVHISLRGCIEKLI